MMPLYSATHTSLLSPVTNQTHLRCYIGVSRGLPLAFHPLSFDFFPSVWLPPDSPICCDLLVDLLHVYWLQFKTEARLFEGNIKNKKKARYLSSLVLPLLCYTTPDLVHVSLKVSIARVSSITMCSLSHPVSLHPSWDHRLTPLGCNGSTVFNHGQVQAWSGLIVLNERQTHHC